MIQDPSLPPGVTDDMLPGNRPEDREYDGEVDRLFDFLTDQIGEYAPDIKRLTIYIEKFFSELEKGRHTPAKLMDMIRPTAIRKLGTCKDCNCTGGRHFQTCPQFRKFLGTRQ